MEKELAQALSNAGIDTGDTRDSITMFNEVTHSNEYDALNLEPSYAREEQEYSATGQENFR
jgi:hypothetical protein